MQLIGGLNAFTLHLQLYKEAYAIFYFEYLIMKLNDRLNMNLKPPVGGRKSLSEQVE